MKKKYFILALLGALVAMPAVADRYDDCKRRASQSTGYYGSNPSRHGGTAIKLRKEVKNER